MADYEYVVKEEDKGIKIKELLRLRLNLSVRLKKKLKDQDGILCNGKLVRMKDRPEVGDIIEINFPKEVSGFEPESIPIRKIFEDRDFLIIDKQAGLVVHPTKGHPSNTIANGLMKYMLDSGESYKIRFVNRLDMNTTGILVIGKNSHVQDEFARQGMDNLIDKKYIAVVQGHLEKDCGIIDLPIGKEEEGALKRTVREDGSPSRTRYRVLTRYEKGYSLVELTLETGRTHQIRVHMSHIGHPVVGDSLYGKEQVWLIERQALHGFSLSFIHPRTGERLKVKSKLPEDMIQLIDKIKK